MVMGTVRTVPIPIVSMGWGFGWGMGRNGKFVMWGYWIAIEKMLLGK